MRQEQHYKIKLKRFSRLVIDRWSCCKIVQEKEIIGAGCYHFKDSDRTEAGTRGWA
jgi:hypothetical protein